MAGGRRHVQSESLKTSGLSHWQVSNPRLPRLSRGAGLRKPLPVRSNMYSHDEHMKELVRSHPSAFAGEDDFGPLVARIESFPMKIYVTPFDGQLIVVVLTEKFDLDDPDYCELIKLINSWKSDPAWVEAKPRLISYLVATGRTYGIG
jgi:hypothetical protein